MADQKEKSVLIRVKESTREILRDLARLQRRDMMIIIEEILKKHKK